MQSDPSGPGLTSMGVPYQTYILNHDLTCYQNKIYNTPVSLLQKNPIFIQATFITFSKQNPMPLPEDNFEEEEEYEPMRSFGDDLYDGIASPIKAFLVNYLGDGLNNAEPVTFRAIEEVIKEEIWVYADSIPDILYRHRTIRDSEEWDKAFDNFTPNKDAVYTWPELENWYHQPDDDDEEEEDDMDNPEMPEEAKRAIELVDEMVETHQKFKAFMLACSDVIRRETRSYLEKNASFDLSILSEEGFLNLQKQINMMAEIVSEDLYEEVASL
jgi:hypothetical protein